MLPEHQIWVMLLLLLPEHQAEVRLPLLLLEHGEEARLPGSPSHQRRLGSQDGRYRSDSWRHSVLQPCRGSRLKKEADIEGQQGI